MGTTREKVRVNVYLDKTITEDAKRLGINLSNSLETALKSELKTKWKERNKQKIETYNQYIASDGLTSRIVAFVCSDESIAFDKISVPIKISSQNYFVCLNVIATIEVSRLEEFVDNISDNREALLAAHDALLSGI